MKLDHIAISVYDIETSVSFYKQYFFWKEIQRVENKENIIVVGDTIFGVVEMFYFYNHTFLQPSNSLWEELALVGIKHFALSVDEQQFDLLYQQFLSDKIPIFQKPTAGSLVNKYFFIKDPNGISVEFLVR